MNDAPDNVAMVLTPPGAAAIAVLRLCGPGVAAFLQAHFSKPPRAGFCMHGQLRDGETIIDDPVVVLAEDGAWAEISLHGGPWIVRCACQLAQRGGFRVLPACLPTPDAAIGPTESPLQGEMLAALPLAKTQLAIKTLLAQPAAWQKALAGRADVAAILQDESLWWLLHPPQIAIVGEPNVGKSTLANQLFGRQRSITADLPGTTRDWVGEMANIDGLAVTLVDTPGQRQTDDPIEVAAIAASQGKIASSHLTIEVLDATHPPQRRWPDSLSVINKTDLPAAWEFSQLDALPISALTGAGLDQLRSRIVQRFGIGHPSRPRWWTPRQKEILARALSDPSALRELGV